MFLNKKYLIKNLKNNLENKTNIDENHNTSYILEKIQNIDRITSNLDNICNEKILEGGSEEYIKISSSKHKKFKAFVRAAKNTIVGYKNLSENYYAAYYVVYLNYIYLLNILKKQKDFLNEKQSQYKKLSKDYLNGKDKISMLETMINNLEKVVSKTTKLDLDIKNNINDIKP